MSVAPHIQAVFEKIDRMKIQSFLHELTWRAMWHTNGSEHQRCRKLEGFGIDGRDPHDATIDAIRAKLAFNRRLEAERPGAGLMPVHIMWLLGALIAEGRLRRQTRRIAQRFASRNFEVCSKKKMGAVG